MHAQILFVIRGSFVVALAASLMMTACLRKGAPVCDRPEESSCFKDCGDGDRDIAGIIPATGVILPRTSTPDIWRLPLLLTGRFKTISANPRGPPFTSQILLCCNPILD